MDSWPLGGLLVVIMLHFAKYHVTATHFRGIHMWWDSLDGDRYVNLYYRVAWKRDWRTETYCDSEVIESRRLIGPPGVGYMKCVGCEDTDVTIGNMLAMCTDYSALENWSSGIGNHTYNFPTAGKFNIKWAGNGWLDGVHEGHDAPWSTRMWVDVTARSDTGKANSSPRSAVPPVIRLQYGCQYTIKLPVTDPDGDVVRCRWANNTDGIDECGGICGAFDGADLNQDDCTLVYTANKQQGYFVAAIQIEDYIRDSTPYISGVNSLSSVPLQFLVLVYETTETTGRAVACDAKPQLISPTPDADSCVVLRPDDEYKIQLVARVSNPHIGFRDFETVSLFGMNKSEVAYYNGSDQEFFVDIMWSPTATQKGQQVFCFSAIDGRSTYSGQRCIYILVTTDEAPKVSRFDYNVTTRQVSIIFDRLIKRPSLRRYVYVFSMSSNTAIMMLDTSINDVTHINDDTLTFLLSEEDTRIKRELYIWLDKGAVQSTPNSRCGVDSTAVKDSRTIVIDTVEGPKTPVASTGGNKKDFTWLIVVVVVLVVLFAIIVAIAVAVQRRKKSKDKYSREERQEEYARTVASKVATNGAYEPDFNDIDVKFR